jgi:hypothetical protein
MIKIIITSSKRMFLFRSSFMNPSADLAILPAVSLLDRSLVRLLVDCILADTQPIVRL